LTNGEVTVCRGENPHYRGPSFYRAYSTPARILSIFPTPAG
jgi:hypothetical protein